MPYLVNQSGKLLEKTGANQPVVFIKPNRLAKYGAKLNEYGTETLKVSQFKSKTQIYSKYNKSIYQTQLEVPGIN